jgi:ParB family chromosome partitioning protein
MAATATKPRVRKATKAVPAAPASIPDMELLHLDPNTIKIRENVRLDPNLDKDFIASVKERGVLVPVQAYRDDLGITILRGERRILAAQQAGHATVPVIVVDQPGDIDRLIDQLAENDHRVGLTAKDHAAAYEQLTLLGLSEGEIARKTRTPEPKVRAGLAAKRSVVASAALAKYDFLDLDQAAAVANFDNDSETVKALVAAAKTGQFDHVLQKARDDRARAKLKADTVAALEADGWTVIDRPKAGASKVEQIDYLKHGSKNLTPSGHKKCPGRAVYLVEDYDWPDTEEGRAAAEKHDYSARVFSYRPVEVCRDPAKHGHAPRYGTTLTGSAKPKPVAEMTEEEQREARERRRDVIDSNKAWDSSVPVRHRWLKEFLARKTAPKTAAGFVAAALASSAHGSHVTTELENRSRLACTMLGVKDPGYGAEWTSELQQLIAAASPERAAMVSLGLVLCAFEAGTSRESWRTINQSTVRYLRFIESQGYVLSDVERRACGEDKPADTDGQADDEAEGGEETD